jgi:tetratricopeptide (TPR) repeat protein
MKRGFAFLIILALLLLSVLMAVQKTTPSDEEQGFSHFIDRARSHVDDFDYDAAIAEMDTAIEIYPHTVELYIVRGQMVLLLYEWDRVLENYNTAIELDPNYAESYFYRGVLYYSVLTSEIPRQTALADFEHYLELAPSGELSEQARDYIDVINSELEALGN